MKNYQKILAGIGAAAVLSAAPYAFAAAEKSPAPAQTVSAEVPALSYLYESSAYNYRVMCPQKPVGVIPASALFENREGEILIFENEEYHIKYAWVVLVHAFPEEALPNLNTINPEEATELLKRIMGSNAYEGIMLVNVTEENKGIFAVTAKEIEIDENGDGTPDATATANSQMAALFFRGENGACYGFELIDNPALRASSVAAFLAGAGTLHTRT
mgnify:FL=1|jgi:hypothetical protein